MRSRDSAPDDSDSASVDLSLGLVDVGDSLDVSVVHVVLGRGSLVRSGLGLLLSSLQFLMPVQIPHPTAVLALFALSCSL